MYSLAHCLRNRRAANLPQAVKHFALPVCERLTERNTREQCRLLAVRGSAGHSHLLVRLFTLRFADDLEGPTSILRFREGLR